MMITRNPNRDRPRPVLRVLRQNRSPVPLRVRKRHRDRPRHVLRPPRRKARERLPPRRKPRQKGKERKRNQNPPGRRNPRRRRVRAACSGPTGTPVSETIYGGSPAGTVFFFARVCKGYIRMLSDMTENRSGTRSTIRTRETRIRRDLSFSRHIRYPVGVDPILSRSVLMVSESRIYWFLGPGPILPGPVGCEREKSATKVTFLGIHTISNINVFLCTYRKRMFRKVRVKKEHSEVHKVRRNEVIYRFRNTERYRACSRRYTVCYGSSFHPIELARSPRAKTRPI